MTQPDECNAKLMVIAHPGIMVKEISPNRLKQIYLNRSKKWQDGSRVHLTILKKQAITAFFISDYLGKSPSQFNRYWKRQLFSGKGIPPEYFDNLKDLLHYIQTTRGAVGFIDSDLPPKGVTVLKLVQ